MRNQPSGTEQLLVPLAMGKVETCPFLQEDVEALKQEIIRSTLDLFFPRYHAGQNNYQLNSEE